jgi:hypothetical protein
MKYVMDCNIGGVIMTITSNTLVACVGAVCDASLYADYAGHVANVNDNPEAEELWSILVGGDCTFSETMTTTSSTGGDTTTETTFDNVEETPAPAPTEPIVFVCGVSYIDAELNCNVNMGCPSGDECSGGETCFAVSYCRSATVTTVAAETIPPSPTFTDTGDSSEDSTATTTTSSFYSWSTSSSEQAVTPSPSILPEVDDTNAGLSDECIASTQDLDTFFSAAVDDALSNCPDAVSTTLDSLTMDYSVCSSSVLDDIEEACIAAGGKA